MLVGASLGASLKRSQRQAFQSTMTTLQGKKILIIGGSSGVGYAVAKAALLSLADHVLIASSSLSRVDAAVQRLLTEPLLQGQLNLQNRVGGDVLDLKDGDTIRKFLDKIGAIDHLIISAGTASHEQTTFKDTDIDKHRGSSVR